MEENEEEYRALIYEYYRIYRPLHKKYNLRERGHFDIYGNNSIEIWEYTGEKRGYCVCKVEEETGIECYKKAIEMLKYYSRKETISNDKRAG